MMKGIMDDQDARAIVRQIGELVDYPLHQLSGILGDGIKNWRVNNQIKFLRKTRERLAAANIDPSRLREEELIPILEKAALITDDSIVAMFASLLISSSDEKSTIEAHPSYIECLSQLNGVEARIINHMYLIIQRNNHDFRLKALKADNACSQLKINMEVTLHSFQNLWRLGICDHGAQLDQLNRSKQIVFTDFGWALIKACNIESSENVD